jgi:hypothetical protein
MVLATDMAQHFEMLTEFQSKIASKKTSEDMELDRRSERLAMQMFLKVILASSADDLL